MRKPSLAALVLASSLTACSDRAPQVIQVPSATAAELDRRGVMTVNGQATLEVSPDCADLTLTITASHAAPGAAVKALDAKKLALVAALRDLGIEESEIKLSNLQFDPVYALTSAGWPTPKVSTFTATITITATTRDFTQLGDMMNEAATAGATSMSTAFRRSDLAALKKKVRDMALLAAKDKAQQTAKTLGIELGRITAVAENQGGHMWSSHYFPKASNVVEANTSAPVVAISGALQPLTLDVTLTFELAKQS
ncbi:MAG TPA: SIMPL domain-containing protein [Kofleriaceae bacterium]|nr:SIMPL domain-containing protein [Kofleriaceae bacterium]